MSQFRVCVGGRCKESGLAKGSRPAGEGKEFKDPSKNRQQTGKRGFSSLDSMCVSQGQQSHKKKQPEKTRPSSCVQVRATLVGCIHRDILFFAGS